MSKDSYNINPMYGNGPGLENIHRYQLDFMTPHHEGQFYSHPLAAMKHMMEVYRGPDPDQLVRNGGHYRPYSLEETVKPHYTGIDSFSDKSNVPLPKDILFQRI